jgi:predicted RNA-binding Zn-ribbon protein involved in translation (DUF1610 family)
MNCDQCDMLSINGVACHELGCPNRGKRYDAESRAWVRQYTCHVCGYKADEDSACCQNEGEAE